MSGFILSIFRFVFLVDSYGIVIVSRVVITNCSSLVNFLLVCVIAPCYVIVFILVCHLLIDQLLLSMNVLDHKSYHLETFNILITLFVSNHRPKALNMTF